MPRLTSETGVLTYDKAKTKPGYTLFSTLGLFETTLVDMDGAVVHSWKLPGEPGNYAYMLPDGHLLAAIRTQVGILGLPAKGGHLIEYDWDGNIVWEHEDNTQHHDFRRLANGNTIYLAWRLLDEDMVKRHTGGLAGSEHADGVYGDVLREINPAGEVVWEWFVGTDMDMEQFPIHPGTWRQEYAHGNTVAECPNGDIMINQRMTGFMGHIDKQTKKFNWCLQDHEFGQQHDVQMLENGNILFFANGSTHASSHGPEVGSRVIELDPADNSIVWEYSTKAPRDFFSWYISGCQRLDNGNTLICEGVWGRIFEVTPECEIVWEYINPQIVDYEHPVYTGANPIFRAYRYAPDSPQIGGRLG